MRQKIIAGNWKMNKNYKEGLELAAEIIALMKNESVSEIQVILSTSFIHLHHVAEMIKEFPNIAVSAQNCYSEASGAFTGEVSAEMIKTAGAKYVIIGHSERRTYFNEDNEFLKNKINTALANELSPIYCCGEKLVQREKGKHFECVEQQIKNTLFHLSPQAFANIIIAYEPVWAIGTGKNATPTQAQEMHKFIRNEVKATYGNEIAENLSIIYGGSCNTQNANELFAKKNVDGGLIGGASLKAKEFIEIVKVLKNNILVTSE